jgi:allantoin racemase
MVEVARATVDPPGLATVRGVTAPFGARTIVTAAETTIAAHAVLQSAARAAGRCDAIIVAAFVDPGLEALREIAGMPCVGLCEAALLEAAEGGRRYAIATGGAHLDATLRGLAARYGVAERLVDIAYLDPPLAEVAQAPGRFLPEFQAAVDSLARRGARAVLIGGGPLSGIAAQLRPPRGVVIIDGIAAAMRRALRRLEAPAPPRARGSGRYRGLDPALAALLRGQPRPSRS